MYRIHREQLGSFADKETHKWEPYKKAFYKARYHMSLDGRKCVSVDPFARNCTWATYRNDINPETSATYNMDAIDFLKHIKSEIGEVDLFLFDPPFSQRQASDKYGSISNVYTKPGYVKECFDLMISMLRPRGRIIKLGYNSTRHNEILDLIELTIMNFGGNRNDVIMTIWERGSCKL
tara:strand:+ start:368 stop:901 length:534 start_codon:yes stop_codon:yes gene_type:complete